MLSNFTEHDETQPLAKFKRIWYIALRATLNFQNLDANVDAPVASICDIKAKLLGSGCLVTK